jgi:hypothetical protein
MAVGFYYAGEMSIDLNNYQREPLKLYTDGGLSRGREDSPE